MTRANALAAAEFAADAIIIVACLLVVVLGYEYIRGIAGELLSPAILLALVGATGSAGITVRRRYWG